MKRNAPRTCNVLHLVSKTSLIVLACLVVAAGCGPSASVAPKERTYDLGLNVKQGDQYAYQISVKSDKAEQNGEMGLTMQVAKVDADKTTFRTTIDSMTQGKTDMLPLLKTAMPNFAIVQVMDERGTVLETKYEGAPQGFNLPMTPTSFSAFPHKPVKVGDTWAAKEGEKEIYKLAAIDTEGGKEVAVIEASEGQEQLKLDKPAVMRVEVATGMLVEATATGTSPQVGKVTMSMKRVEKATS